MKIISMERIASMMKIITKVKRVEQVTRGRIRKVRKIGDETEEM